MSIATLSAPAPSLAKLGALAPAPSPAPDRTTGPTVVNPPWFFSKPVVMIVGVVAFIIIAIIATAFVLSAPTPATGGSARTGAGHVGQDAHANVAPSRLKN